MPDAEGPRARSATYAITAAIVAVVLIGPIFVVSNALRSRPSHPTYPAVLVPSSGAYLGAFASPRTSEDPKKAMRRLESQLGRKLAIDHDYYNWDDPIPTPRQEWDASTGRLPFIDWAARDADGTPVAWSAIASGSQDAWIIQRADAVKAFGSPMYLAFHHEPEDDLATLGSPSDYAAGVPSHRGRLPQPGASRTWRSSGT